MKTLLAVSLFILMMVAPALGQQHKPLPSDSLTPPRQLHVPLNILPPKIEPPKPLNLPQNVEYGRPYYDWQLWRYGRGIYSPGCVKGAYHGRGFYGEGGHFGR